MSMDSVMYKNKNGNRNNISGIKIAEIRKNISPTMSQRALADKLQLFGLDLDKNAIQRIESGERFVTDIELLAFSKVLNTPIEVFLN
jgi:transcriptional regulator with XRE-family HTH domain